jgi:UDP-glucose 4-epimerase
MHILVTGGSGFIGSHLTQRLLAENHSVCVVDDLSTGRPKNLETVSGHPNLEIIHSDLANVRLVRNQCRRADQVYHLAAAVGVALIAARPTETIHRNIYPTQLLLEALQEEKSFGRNVPLFLASTSEVYGKNPKPIWTENDDLVFGATTKPRWSYGASKAIDEFLALAGVREHQLPVVIGRFFNVVGPRQTGTYGMVLPRFVTAAMNGGPLVVHDDGQQQRCFAHVLDVIDAIVQLMANKDAYGRVYNIGSDQPISIVDLAEKVRQIVNPQTRIVYQSYTEAYDSDFEDIRRRVPDLSRLRATIDYQPKRSLDTTIRDIWETNLAEIAASKTDEI